MDLVGLAALLAVPVSAVTVGIAIAREWSQIRLLERVVKLRTKVGRGSTTDFTLLWLEQSLAEDLLRSRLIGPVRALGVTAILVELIALSALTTFSAVAISTGFRDVPSWVSIGVLCSAALAGGGAGSLAASLIWNARMSRSFARDWAVARSRFHEIRKNHRASDRADPSGDGAEPKLTVSEDPPDPATRE